MAHRDTTCPRGSTDRVYLRATVLRVGGLLGWKAHDVISFTEALTGRGWRHCGPDEFQIVLDEYLQIGQVIQDKAARRAGHARGWDTNGGGDATPN